jgi:hypothetical protein
VTGPQSADLGYQTGHGIPFGRYEVLIGGGRMEAVVHIDGHTFVWQGNDTFGSVSVRQCHPAGRIAPIAIPQAGAS